jgi:nucleotide-binding universal stress UspA family protein
MTVLERMHDVTKLGYRRVVMPVDFSPLSWRVLPLARTVARTMGVDLEPVHIDTASPWRDAGEGSKLTLTAAPFGRRLEVNVVAASDPAAGITDFAEHGGQSLIAMSTHGHTGIGEMAFGSVCEGVLRRADTPVLAVGPDFDIGRHSVVHRIVVCIDASADSLVVVPDALLWAHAFDVPLELMTVLPGQPAADLTPEREAALDMERVARELSQDHERISAFVLHGSRAGFEIVRYADSVPGTLLVMSTHARPALSRAVVGSVVMHVARHSTTGVLLRRRPLPTP